LADELLFSGAELLFSGAEEDFIDDYYFLNPWASLPVFFSYLLAVHSATFFVIQLYNGLFDPASTGSAGGCVRVQVRYRRTGTCGDDHKATSLNNKAKNLHLYTSFFPSQKLANREGPSLL
jgi:hypothetical protein